MKYTAILAVLVAGFSVNAMAQSVTVDVPSGYRVVIIPNSAPTPATVYVAPQPVVVAPAPVYRAHPYARHVASVGEGMIIEHQIDDHHH
nr:hypothetical protein [uncultured Enterobacter sp.]